MIAPRRTRNFEFWLPSAKQNSRDTPERRMLQLLGLGAKPKAGAPASAAALEAGGPPKKLPQHESPGGGDAHSLTDSERRALHERLSQSVASRSGAPARDHTGADRYSRPARASHRRTRASGTRLARSPSS